jgi:hypothetical protein
MPMLVRAYPLDRPVSELQAFAAALSGERQAEVGDFYRRYGVSHESWHLQETPTGPWVIAVTIVDDPAESAPRLALSDAGFDAWFKGQVRALSGVDPATTPLGPPTTRVFEWSDAQRPHSNPCA